MANINIQGNTFNDNSSVIQNYHKSDYYNNEYIDELYKLKNSLNDNNMLSEAISQLTAALETKNKETTKNTILKYIGELFSKTFTSVASAGLVEYIKSFLG